MFKTKINKPIFLVFVIIMILHILAIADESAENGIRYNPRYSIWLVLLALFLSTRTIVFTNNRVIVRYLHIPVWRISVNRISSIEFVMQKGESYLVVGFDGCLPIAESHKKLDLFMVSSEMIVILIPDKKCQEYIDKITQLYSNVSFVNWESTTY